MGIGRRIKEARLLKNMKQEELAALIGVTASAVGNYENDVSHPKETILYKLFDALDVDPNYLFQDEVRVTSHPRELYTREEIMLINDFRRLDKYGKRAVLGLFEAEVERVANEGGALNPRRVRVMPVMYSLPEYAIPVSAGTGSFLDSDSYEMLYLEDKPPEGASFVVRVAGDSMEPTYYDGDKLFVKQQPSIETGEIGIFMINGEVFVKELASDGLVSHNSKYKKIEFNEYDSIRCYGKVIGKI